MAQLSDRVRTLMQPHLASIEPYDPNFTPCRVNLSANENTYPMPAAARASIDPALAATPLNRYPDPMSNELRAEIAAWHGVDPSWVCVGNGGDVRAVITQPGQFACMRESIAGSYNSQNVYNMRPTDIHYQIADWAMAGGRLAGVDDSLFFFNPYSAVCPEYFPTRVARFHIRVGDHCFYSPTAYYAET